MNNHYDTSYIKAEQAYKATQIREQIVGRRRAARLRKERSRQRRDDTTWES